MRHVGLLCNRNIYDKHLSLNYVHVIIILHPLVHWKQRYSLSVTLFNGVKNWTNFLEHVRCILKHTIVLQFCKKPIAFNSLITKSGEAVIYRPSDKRCERIIITKYATTSEPGLEPRTVNLPYSCCALHSLPELPSSHFFRRKMGHKLYIVLYELPKT
jgi:hypothetical protein